MKVNKFLAGVVTGLFLSLIIASIASSGTDTLSNIASSPTLVPATSEQYNAIVDAVQGHQVMRNDSGAVTDNTYDLGRPSSGRPRDLHLGRNLYVDGSQIDFNAISLSSTGITSGASKASGYPAFLVAGGAGNDYCTVSATATNMIGTIDGAAFILEVDLDSDDLSLASGTGNTCAVNDSDISGDPEWSKTIGEFGQYITIDDIGATITAYDNTIQAFKIYNGSETEVFLGRIETANNFIYPILRGIGGTDRIAFSDDDVITHLKAHYVFMDDNLATIDSTTVYPTYGATAPTSPGTGDYWFDSVNETWQRYSGASWESPGRIYLGIAISDDTDCLWVEPTDFNLAWSSYIGNGHFQSSVDAIYSFNVEPFLINVAGVLVETNEIQMNNFTLSGNLESGYSEAASTWYYLYISNAGEIVLSPEAPRKKDRRLGCYHPKEYWRCMGAFYNSSTSNFSNSSINPGKGLHSIAYNYSYVDVSSIPSSYADVHLILPPICEAATLSFRQQTYETLNAMSVADGKLVALYPVSHSVLIGTTGAPIQISLHQIGNANITLWSVGTYTMRMAPVAFSIDW